MSYVKIGVAGPVGSGKTALIECLTRKMAGQYSIGVITNDIYTKEDAEFLMQKTLCFQESALSVWKPAAAPTRLFGRCFHEPGSSR